MMRARGVRRHRESIGAEAAGVQVVRRVRAVDPSDLHRAAAGGAGIVVFPEVFIPGTPIWIDSRPIWNGDDEWYAMLVDQAVLVPGPVTEALGAAACETRTYLVVGVEEREAHGTTIYNTMLYFGPDGSLLGKHRKLMPTGSERTVWGMGDGSTLPVIDVSGTVINASGEAGEPNHAGSSNPLNSVWWTWTPSTSERTTISVGGKNLAVYTGASVDALTEVVSSAGAQVAFNPVAGTNYHIAVDGPGSSTGNFSLKLTHAFKNTFATATVIPGTPRSQAARACPSPGRRSV